ncbi:efflux RND transporter periplasmic adaptor subunit [Gemmata sp. JC673]|uniref:Efflux RND transporter periplasmic adaptor subunit n=1 Tax=Gemmata algarum TaxID=2975278 RepID=A0ABU5EWS2_9BACT|nr:efflux RND transporter periplasmic adaptor subunit [Gemmata algarum]MDY3558161.1 efflux RND transporter periplasmic adaptor subunit [Gemmata algarum]
MDPREGQTVSRLQGIATAALTLALAAAVGAGAWWLVTNKPAATKADKPPGPATVAKVVKEDDLNTVALTEEAEKRLGLALAPVETKAVRRVRVYGGEVTVPVGQTILVAAPLGGTLKAPAGGVPKAGSVVKAGQPVFQLAPLLTPDGRATLSAALAEANGQVNTAKASFDLTDIAVKRAERVLKEGAGSQRLVDEARAAFDVAKRTLDAAAARQVILNKVVGDAEGGTVAPVPIDAPQGGILRVVSALPGQTVPSGSALFEVIDLSTLWVRVPLPVGDLDGTDRNEPAQVGKLSAPPGVRLPAANPVAAPPSANPLAATVDVFYELPNADGKLTPGQRLGVTVPLTDAKASRTVPWSAVVWDTDGGTWVYERIAPRTYKRRRVLVAYTSGADAVLADVPPNAPPNTPPAGPSVGAVIVTKGVQELFGAETGFIK